MNEYLATAVDELYRLGIREVVFSPGSRSTALAVLFTAYGQFTTYMNLDERSAGFFALGLAKAQRRPVVLVCTSGSAGAHYWPAVAEAKHSRVPLIILTADRPPELQGVGAPQTMAQGDLFGEFTAYHEELARPSEGTPEVYARTVMQKAVLAATGAVPAPVHINIPIGEPLMPATDAAYFERGRSAHGFAIMDWAEPALLAEVQKSGKGIILCGPDYESGQYSGDVLALARRWHAPVLADPLSAVRMLKDEYIIDSYDAFLSDDTVKDILAPDYIILFGQIPVSKRLQQFVARHKEALFIQVDSGNEYRNPALTTNRVVRCRPADFCRQAVCADEGDSLSDDGYVSLWRRYQQRMRARLDTVSAEPALFEGRIIRRLQEILPATSRLVAANSMTIRDVDYFWPAGCGGVTVLGNRGVNGIDGTASTALGIAADGMPTVLVTGDLSFLHDMNGLIVGKTHRLSLTIVLLNNDGGGIFEYLAQRQSPYFEYLFATPHGLDFGGLQRLLGIAYTRADTYEMFEKAVAISFNDGGIHLIEVPTNRARSRELHRKYTVMP